MTDSTPGARMPAAILRIVDGLAASRWKSAAAILIVAIVCFLPGFDRIPPIDRQETLSAFTGQRMVATGNLATGGVTADGRIIGPVAVEWLIAATIWATGHAGYSPSPLWVYRLPSMALGLVAALLTWWTALGLAGRRAALIAGLMFPAGLVVAGAARLAGPGAGIAASVLLGMGALARIWAKPDDPPGLLMPFLFWSGLGLGVLAGGFAVPVLFGLVLMVLSFERGGIAWLGRLAPLPGLLWLVVLLTPGAIAMLWPGVPVDGGKPGAALLQTQATFSAPPGTYLATFPIFFWPGAAFVLLAVPYALDRAGHRPVLFLLAWAVPFWLLIELWPGKLPQYLVPAWPALVILAAMAMDEGALKSKGVMAWVVRASVVLVPLVVGSYAALGYFEDNGFLAPAIVLFFAAALAASLLVFRFLGRGRSGVSALLTAAIAFAFFGLGAFGMVLPGLDRLRVGEKAIAEARRALPCADPKIAVVGFREPSILLAGGAMVRVLSAADAAAFLSTGTCRAVILDRRRQASFAQRTADLGVEVEVRGTAKGLNLGTLRPATLHVVVPKAIPE